MLQMMQSCQTLLDPTHGFCVLNLYSMGYAPVIAANLLQPLCPEIAYGHLMAEDTHHRCLPLGVYARGAY